MTPYEALDKGNHWILNQQQERKRALRKVEKPKFKRSEFTRISLENTKFQRGYNVRSSDEVFQIHEVHTKGLTTPVYSLISVGPNPEPLFSRWYSYELIRVPLGTFFKVKSVLERDKTHSTVNFKNLQENLTMRIPNKVLAKKKTFQVLKQYNHE